MSRAGTVSVKFNARDLSRAVTAFTKAKQADAEVVLIKVATGVASDAQLATPVLTGRARAGWSAAILRFGGGRLNEGQGVGLEVNAAAIQEGRALGRVVLSKRDPNRPRITVTNGVWYIVDLEAGSSPQADAGWFAAVLERWTTHLHREANR